MLLLLYMLCLLVVILGYVYNFHLPEKSDGFKVNEHTLFQQERNTVGPLASFATEPLWAPESPSASEHPQQNAQGSHNKFLDISVEH